MRHDRGAPGLMTKCTGIVLSIAAAWPFGMSIAGAQSMMRSPSVNIGSRVPAITPSTMPRINPNIAVGAGSVAGRGPSIVGRGPSVSRVGHTGVGAQASTVGPTASRTPPASSRPGRRPPPKIVGVLPTIPYVRYSPNTYPGCAHANSAASGECNGKPFVADLGGGGPTPRGQNIGGGPRSNGPQAALNTRYVPRQIVAELDSALTPDQASALAQRLRLEPLLSQDFPLIGATISLFRIADNRSVEAVESQMRAEAGVRAVQPNFRYVLQEQVTTPALGEGDPAQYALAKLRLPEAHRLSAGANVTVAVIDSGIDVAHPELADAVVGSFDALDSREGAHVHGTGIAGAIVSHARLMGSAPRARILAIRAFGVSQKGAESSSFVILKSINHAVMNGAQVINMSFAGPQDPLVERGIAASASKGIVMVAASGNAGPKSPPLYPAASPSVIAVSATDAYDKLFAASNRGNHIAVAAPGVDIFLPAPDNKYQMTSGTSFSAAYISGLAALMIERNPQLRPNEIRGILMTTARDLGAPGRDDLFGAGAADAFSAVSAVQGAQRPVATAPAPVTPVVATEPAAVTRAFEASSPSMASGAPK